MKIRKAMVEDMRSLAEVYTFAYKEFDVVLCSYGEDKK